MFIDVSTSHLMFMSSKQWRLCYMISSQVGAGNHCSIKRDSMFKFSLLVLFCARIYCAPPLYDLNDEYLEDEEILKIISGSEPGNDYIENDTDDDVDSNTTALSESDYLRLFPLFS